MANTTKEQITALLSQLDSSNNAHWTDDGLPRVDVVQKLADDLTIKRTDINEAAVGFSRATISAAEGDGGATGDPTEQLGSGLTPADGVTKAAPPVTDEDFEVGTDIAGPAEALSEDDAKTILGRRVEQAETNLEAARKAVRDAQTHEINCVRRQDRAISDFHRRFPPLSFAQNMKNHLAAQQARLIAEVEARGAQGTSQLDRAMQFRGSRGSARPTRPVQNITA